MTSASPPIGVILFAVVVVGCLVADGVTWNWQYRKAGTGEEQGEREDALQLLKWLSILHALSAAVVMTSWLITGRVRRVTVMFQGVILTVFGYLNSLLLSAILTPLLPLSSPAAFSCVAAIAAVFTLCFFLQFTSLAVPRLRPTWYLLLVSWPATWYFSSVLLSLSLLWIVFLIPSPLALLLLLLPFLLSLFGLYQSLTDTVEHLTIDVRPTLSFPSLRRLPLQAKDTEESALLSPHDDPREPEDPEEAGPNGPKTLRIMQITDPHLGPFMSVNRLQSICRDVVREDPDLVLLTGDFYTLEGEHTPGSLAAALSPLKPLNGRLFACFGNHDIESKTAREATVKDLQEAGVVLLVDEEVAVDLPGKGRVQVVGVDFFGRKHRPKVTEVCRRLKRREDCPLRIIMLHDPAGFPLIDPDDGGLVFSGHTHGGQLGFVSLGLPSITLAGLVHPANGYWGHGHNRNYIGRGQGCRFMFANFLVRLGVPTETAVMTFRW